MERNDESVRELVHKIRCMHETYRKMQRKIINEPESEAKYEKLELMQLVLNRTSEIVNWWNNYEAKQARREKMKQELELAKKRRVTKEKVTKQIEEAVKPYEQEFNKKCKYYNCNYLGEQSCSCGMYMTFCSKSCAFATNAVCSTKAYESPIYENNRRKKR